MQLPLHEERAFVGQEETIARVVYLAMLVELDQIRPAPSSSTNNQICRQVVVEVLYKVYVT